MPRTSSILDKSTARSSATALDGIIHEVRGERVILDADLARVYGVGTKVLNQAVKRNRAKFPSDFMLQLNAREMTALMRSQSVTASPGSRQTMRSQFVTASKRNLRHRPFAFTEHGAIMVANILNSAAAVQMSVFVVRAFIKMRASFTDTRELARKLATLEKDLKTRLDTHESAIVDVLQRVMALLDPPPSPELPAREMGFHATLKTTPKKTQ